ncbi:sec-independent protein translocase protein TatA [Geodermatophilus bullaregiensis]|uniref:Sec-independent protein translocase subunit TatA n=1 Tax=Geodermatophilus bullaregiensis TaxID=1564160 RepID=UPI00195D281E|nr:Sec-independent protein translocase subunit TatA [Geodermatophilus bullaregiensis]MBM7804279.1 sec-independent protein translocase protein TatA [Geodermatophilus bullaregiensis]
MNLGAPEIILIILAILLLFGYKKLPDASRSLGRSLRIFKGEMKGMKDDDRSRPAPAPLEPSDADRRAALEAEAAAAEARAAELRARAGRPGAADPR